MPVRFLFDHNVRGAVARGLRQREVDLLTAFEDGAHEMEDPDLLQRSVLLDRVLYTHDDDLLSAADEWQEEGRSFPGIIFVHQTQLTIGEQIEELELIGKAAEPEELRGKVTFLPMR